VHPLWRAREERRRDPISEANHALFNFAPLVTHIDNVRDLLLCRLVGSLGPETEVTPCFLASQKL
jgi:hypothetical protein